MIYSSHEFMLRILRRKGALIIFCDSTTYLRPAGSRFVVEGHGERGVHHLGQKKVRAGRMAGRHTQVWRAAVHMPCNLIVLPVVVFPLS